MKAAIALLAILIVGSHAANSDDAATAVAQANQLLSSLQTQISQNISGAADIINANLGEITKVFDDLSKSLVDLKNGLSASAASLIQPVIASIAGLNLNLPDANTLLAPGINNITSQTSALVNPSIDALNTTISNGNTALQCFTNEVPKITGNATEVVTKVSTQISSDTKLVIADVTRLEDLLRTGVNEILEKAKNCSGLTIIVCIANIVSLRMPFKVR